jgi:threonine/homoserine/homoserine lactone efflux protein
MIPYNQLLLFGVAALIMVLSPGPNMIYLVSRSICQGPKAAVISLSGVALGFVMHMLLAAFGLTAFFLAVPMAYAALKYLGAGYLLWLAYQAIKPGTRGLFEPRQLAADSPVRLFWMGFFTNALNPKIAVFYVSIFSQFLDPTKGSVLMQSVELGVTQILISMTVNFMIIQFAGTIASWFQNKPVWAQLQRWVMATVLGGLAAKLALSDHK